MVRVVVDGSMRVRKIEIDAAIVAANDKSMLEDLILVAVNDGTARARRRCSPTRWASSGR